MANDQNNRMPPKAQKTRTDQLAYINKHIQALSQDPRYKELVEYLHQHTHNLSEKDARSIQLARRGINFSQKFSHNFTEEFARAKSKSLEARHQAKEKNDWYIFAPYLEKSLVLAKEYAHTYNPKIQAYDVRCDSGHPGMTTQIYHRLFQPIIETSTYILNISSTLHANHKLHITTFDWDILYSLIQELIQDIGYDITQGTFSIIKRPYSENCGPWDERIHIGHSKWLLESILAALHECWHGLTDMYINPEYHWTNIHRSLPMWVHESQARTLENFIGRSKPFCVYLITLLEKYFPQLGPRNAEHVYQYLNDVAPEVIRTNADELTYNIHIYIRFLIEESLFNGSIDVYQVPEKWNELYSQYLWLTPQHYNEWCLQDQHRALWLFGYFPAYTIWNMAAAQMWEEYRNTYPLRWEAYMEGDFSQYFSWYKHAVWRHGNMYHPDVFIENITWKPIGPESLVKYLNEKYLAIPWTLDRSKLMCQERALNEELIEQRTVQNENIQESAESFKEIYDDYYTQVHQEISYLPTESQRDSQWLISTAAQDDATLQGQQSPFQEDASPPPQNDQYQEDTYVIQNTLP